MKRLMRSPRATVMIAVLACCVSAQAEAGPPQCLLGSAAASARLVCDQDGCVRPRSDTDCALTPATVVRVDRVRQPSLVRKRFVRDDVGLLLARLD
jgi:hypothetical protein